MHASSVTPQRLELDEYTVARAASPFFHFASAGTLIYLLRTNMRAPHSLSYQTVIHGGALEAIRIVLRLIWTLYIYVQLADSSHMVALNQ